jgi:hypothetical protein
VGSIKGDVKDPAGLAAVDLSNPQSWNRYAYVINDPLIYFDPLGLQKANPDQQQAPGGGGYWYCVSSLNDNGDGLITSQVLFCVGGGGNRGPTDNTDPGSAANNATISAIHGYEGSKKQFCDQQSNKAFIEEILPGGSVLLGRDYRPSAVLGATAEIGVDRALDWGAKTTAVLSTVRSWTGLPMSVASKILTGTGYLLTARTLYKAVAAMQREYKACMEN